MTSTEDDSRYFILQAAEQQLLMELNEKVKHTVRKKGRASVTIKNHNKVCTAKPMCLILIYSLFLTLLRINPKE